MIRNTASSPKVSATTRRFSLALVALISVGLSAAANANRVDRIDPSQPGFTDSYFVDVSAGTPTDSITETGIFKPSTYQGRRDVNLDVNGGTGAQSFKLAGDSFLELDNDANTSSILQLAYGVGNGNTPDHFGNKFNAIAITVSEVSNDNSGLGLGSGRFTLTLQSGTTVGTSTVGIDFTQPGTYVLNFNDPGFAGINFSQIQRVTVNLTTTTAGSDFRIDSIFRTVAVPEPSTWALLTAGIAGILALTLRRRAARV